MIAAANSVMTHVDREAAVPAGDADEGSDFEDRPYDGEAEQMDAPTASAKEWRRTRRTRHTLKAP